MPAKLPKDIEDEVKKIGLPTGGQYPFEPKWTKNKKGKLIIKRAKIAHGPRRGKKGYEDQKGRIWIKDRAHGSKPDHWDVQEDGGKTHTNVDPNGNII